MARAIWRLTLDCDNACVFCAQKGLVATASSGSFTEALPRLRESSEGLTFVGGEPGLVPDLADAIAQARAAGFKRVGLQTNGGALSAPGVVALLAKSGLTDIQLSIHGTDAAIHDHLVGREGALEQALRTLSSARAQRIEVAVASVVTRSNYRHLTPVGRLLATSGVSAWGIVFAESSGRAGPSFDRLLPRLGLAMPHVLHAVDSANQSRLPTFLFGAPVCLAGPFAPRIVSTPTRAFGAVCGTCPAQASCPGVDAGYLSRFGGDELRPRAAVIATRPPQEERLLDLFAGTGETGPATLPPHIGTATATTLPIVTLKTPTT